MVQEIESIRAELQPPAFAQPGKPKSPAYGDIDIVEAGPCKCIAPGCA